jgi:hypothetical protein
VVVEYGVVDKDLGFDNDGVRDCHDGFPEIIDKTVPSAWLRRSEFGFR